MQRDGNTMTLLIAVTIFMGAVLIAGEKRIQNCKITACNRYILWAISCFIICVCVCVIHDFMFCVNSWL